MRCGRSGDTLIDGIEAFGAKLPEDPYLRNIAWIIPSVPPRKGVQSLNPTTCDATVVGQSKLFGIGKYSHRGLYSAHHGRLKTPLCQAEDKEEKQIPGSRPQPAEQGISHMYQTAQ